MSKVFPLHVGILHVFLFRQGEVFILELRHELVHDESHALAEVASLRE